MSRTLSVVLLRGSKQQAAIFRFPVVAGSQATQTCATASDPTFLSHQASQRQGRFGLGEGQFHDNNDGPGCSGGQSLDLVNGRGGRTAGRVWSVASTPVGHPLHHRPATSNRWSGDVQHTAFGFACQCV